MMMHHHTMFGFERWSALEEIIWTKPGHSNSDIPHLLNLIMVVAGGWRGGNKNALQTTVRAYFDPT